MSLGIDELDVRIAHQGGAWRAIRSLWIVPVFLGAGYLSWAGWVWAGTLASSRRVWRTAAAWSAMSILTGVLTVLGRSGDVVHQPWDTLASLSLVLTWFGGTLHAVILRRRVLRDHMARRVQLGLAAPLAPAALAGLGQAASPATSAPTSWDLRGRLEVLTGQVRVDPRLPDDVRAACTRLHDALAALVDRVGTLDAGSESRFVVGRIVDDYLPQSLNAYVGLPREFAEQHRLAGGRTPREEFLHQLDLMTSEVQDIAVGIYTEDAQALATQTRFLEDRFARSALRLPGQG